MLLSLLCLLNSLPLVMSKIIYCILILVFFNICFYAQVSQEWVARFNGLGNGFDYAGELIADSSGNIYVAGQSELNKINSKLVVIKYAPGGTQQWVTYYTEGNDTHSVARAIALDKNNFIYVTGTSYNTFSMNDFVTLKLDSLGNILWTRRFDNNFGNDHCYFIEIDSLNNVIIAGNCSSGIMLIKYNSEGEMQWSQAFNANESTVSVSSMKLDKYGNTYLTGSTSENQMDSDGIVLKYNKDGDLIWTKRFNSTSNSDDFLYSIAVGNDNSIYATGEIMLSPFASDCVTVKYDSAGTLEWYNIYNGPANDIDLATHIELDSMGKIYVGGQTMGSNNVNNYLLIKYNSEGTQEWLKTFEGPYNDIISDMVIDRFGDIYVTGSGGVPLMIDYLTIKYNSNGTMAWLQVYNGPGNQQDAATGLIVDLFSNVYVTGYSRGVNPFHDIATVKYSQVIGINPISTEIPGKFSLSQNYPNPFNPSTRIKFTIPAVGNGRDRSVKILVYDMLGREIAVLVNEQLNPGTYEVNWDASAYPSGVYFYKLLAENILKQKEWC